MRANFKSRIVSRQKWSSRARDNGARVDIEFDLNLKHVLCAECNNELSLSLAESCLVRDAARCTLRAGLTDRIRRDNAYRKGASSYIPGKLQRVAESGLEGKYGLGVFVAFYELLTYSA